MVLGCPCSDRRRIGHCFESCCVAAVQEEARWQVFHCPGSRSAHIVPVDDVIEHSISDGCLCGPQCEMVEHDSGGDAWLYHHHSADGREFSE